MIKKVVSVMVYFSFLKPSALVGLFLGVSLVLLTVCGEPVSASNPTTSFSIAAPAVSATDDVDRPNHCKVFDIVDGDTFTCDFNGDGVIVRKTEKVRMLYVDTPEIHHSKRNPTGQPQPFSKEAKAYATSQLLGKMVYLRYDVKPEDRYGRKLALVYTVNPAKTKSLSVNEQLVIQGLARLMVIKPNTAFQHPFEALELQAIKAKKGLWQLPENEAFGL
jgi:micrococcal nuclease